MPTNPFDSVFLPFAVFVVPPLLFFVLASAYLVRSGRRRPKMRRLPTVRGPVERLLWWWR